MSKINVEFGETREDRRISALGKIRHALKISPSFALCALDLNDYIDYSDFFEIEGNELEQRRAKSKVMDVLLTKKDGWTKDILHEIVTEMIQSKDGSSQIKIVGYPERRREKFSDHDSSIFCIHALTAEFIQNDGDGTNSKKLIYKVAPMIQEETKKGISNKVHEMPNKNSDRGANDASRFAKLVFFLLSEFGGYEGLSKFPVLDIAGGSGGLAFELSVRHQLPCIVVDTREIQYSVSQKRHLKFRKASSSKLNELSSNSKGSTPLMENLMRRFQAGVQDGCLSQLKTLLDTDSVLNFKSKYNSIGNDGKNGKDENDPEIQRAKLSSLINKRRCSVLVGLHPDQATDPIMDIGFALNIPWVVVPCCVFPNLFSQRRLQPSGRIVRTYDDLCEYILQRDPGVKESTLPFRGRNRVFFWHPQQAERKSNNQSESMNKQ